MEDVWLWLMIINCTLYCLATIFLIYSIGMLLFVFAWKMFLLSILLIAIVNVTQFTLAILND